VLGEMHEGARRGLVVMARDRGPGIADVGLALQDGFSTSSGLGCGLPGARRLVDDLHVETELGVGTIVTIKKWLR
jgi:serine/threonine-protein kinase RsbT